ncbi:hypothetical protein N3K66_007555 [Trichothecium roseum]|uniref:Uncharacterized protein n=1 Tax=Trichothecium roseum TaxID=47278 RepID=A0ACC0UVZ5_9HYPO|nr:hypothetical protein N3K66_007555 [Trichothecium roseum]
MLVFASGTPQRKRWHRRWEQSPVATPSDLELCQFAGTLDGNSQPLLWQFFTSLKESMYPMELCFHFDNAKTMWYQWLSVDTAYFNSVLFTVSAFNDVCRNRSRHGRGGSGGNDYILLDDDDDDDDDVGHFSSSNRARRADAITSLFAPRTRAYLSRTMAQLQERLYDGRRQCDDVTVAVVVTLAMTADVAGDEEACRAHVGGLMRIVEARGGLGAFDGNKQLQMKLLRIDLAWAMKHGARPRFADRGLVLDWRPRFRAVLARESPVAPDAAVPEAAARLCARVSPELAGAYADMHAFASVAGRLFRGREKLRPELYQDMMVSVQYRLLLLGGGESDGGGRSEMAGEGGEGGRGGRSVVEECFRLGLLAFQTSVFVTNLGVRVRYAAVAESMREALRALRPADDAETSLKLWALLVGAVVVFGPPSEGKEKEGVEGGDGDGEEEEGPWLARALGEVAALMSWEEVERRLRDVLWIDVLLGERGRKVFERAAAAAGLRR